MTLIRHIKIYSKICAILLAAVATLATACSDNIEPGGSEPALNADGTYNAVIEVALQRSTVASRASESPFSQAISAGASIDRLTFAIYEVEYDTDGATVKKATRVDATPKEHNITVPADFSDNKTVELTLSLDPAKNYRIAFWAQSSTCNAYNTDNLDEVKVSYATVTEVDGEEVTEGVANNDDNRDAFCGYLAVDAGATVKPQTTIVLHRPFAQINVGTAGWDYESMAYMEPQPMILTQSKITIKGVAQYYNVVTGKAIVDDTDHPTTTAEFTYSRMPAFVNVEGKITKPERYSNEEFLRVKLYTEDDELSDAVGNTIASAKDFFPYRDWIYFEHFRWGTTDEDPEKGDFKDKKFSYNGEELTSTDLLYEGVFPKTETFKYMSMSYVLVPEPAAISNVPDVSYGSLLEKVTFDVKGWLCDYDVVDYKVANVTVPDNAEELEVEDVFELSNVPVQKNWRTNILSDNFFVFYVAFRLTVISDFSGDWDQIGLDDKWSNLDEHDQPIGIRRPNNEAKWPEDDDYFTGSNRN